jgi:hypothetical protein
VLYCLLWLLFIDLSNSKGNKKETPSSYGVVEHISCAVGLPKVVVYLFFVDLGKNWLGPS